MYLRLTSRCNMTCPHCCFAATRKGEDMSREVFITALSLAARYGEMITLGGGEPTVHKEFFAFLDKAIEYKRVGSIKGGIFIITNGKLKSKAHKLLDMIENEDAPIEVELSQDEWHDPIDPGVVQRFRYWQKARDSRRNGYYGGDYPKAGIRSVRRIIPVGRAADPARGIWQVDHDLKCACEDVVVDPDGTVWSCGCRIHKLGDVWQHDVIDGYDWEYAHEGGFAPSEDEDDTEYPLMGSGLPALEESLRL